MPQWSAPVSNAEPFRRLRRAPGFGGCVAMSIEFLKATLSHLPEVAELAAHNATLHDHVAIVSETECLDRCRIAILHPNKLNLRFTVGVEGGRVVIVLSSTVHNYIAKEGGYRHCLNFLGDEWD